MNRRKYLAATGGIITLSGCTELTPENLSSGEESGTLLEVTVDWDYLEGMVTDQTWNQSGSSSQVYNINNEQDITHVGARIEYQEAEASFSQSTTKSLADDEGIITLDVPPTDNANIYLAAVSYDDDNQSALLFAGKEGISIEEDTANEWTIDDFEWTTTEWYVDEEYQQEFDMGVFHVDKDKSRFELPYYVTYPFHQGQDPTYEQVLVGLSGTGSLGENTDAYHEHIVSAENPSPGETGETTHTFNPYLVSEHFSLPPGRYKIEPVGEFTVIWD